MPLLPLLPGSWQQDLDQQAHDVLMADRAARGVVRINDKKDWLSDGQLEVRQSREVQSTSGVDIDRLWEQGMYRRAYNSMANTRPARARRYLHTQDPWGQDFFESFDELPPGSLIPSLFRPERFVETGAHYTWDVMLPHRVRVFELTDVEVFVSPCRWVWECPDCTCDNYFDSGEKPAPCQYCGIRVVLDQ